MKDAMIKKNGNTASRNETAARLEAFCQGLSARGIGGAVLDRRDDQFYFTGYTGSDAVLVLSTKKGRGCLVTDARYTEEAEKTAPGLEVVTWKGGFAQFVGKLLAKHRFRKVAYTPNSMTAAFYQGMSGNAARVTEWEDADPEIVGRRAVKSPSEIAAIARAIACAEAAFTASRKRWKIGMSESEVKNDLEWEMRLRGAEDAAFETIVAVGPNASLPHAHAGARRIAPGKMILIDFGARVDRYNSDLTRTLWPDSIPAAWLKRYRTVLSAQQAGIAAVGAGRQGRAPDAEARAVFARRKMEKFFTHSLGHGVGLAVHEEPRLSRLSAKELVAGNVVTVEPGLYFPGSGGIRIEDMVLVEENGCRMLSSLSKNAEDMVF